MNRKKILVVSCLMLVLGVFATSTIVVADTSDVTTRWIVPADTTISVSYPNGESLIEFNAAGKSFSELSASSQTASLSALRVTNNGNSAVQLEGSWTTDWPTNVTYVNMSIDAWDDNTTYGDDWLSYSSSNETVDQVWIASLNIGGNEDFWFWSSGSQVEETAGVDRTLRITSTNV